MNKKSSIIIISLIALFFILSYLFLEKNVYYYYDKGLDAYHEKDYAIFLKHFKKANSLAPENPFIVFELGRAYALTDNKPAAIECLQNAISVGYHFDPTQDDFNSLRGTEAFKTIQQRLAEMKTPVTSSSVAFKIPETDLFPESIAYDPVDKVFYVGSVYNRKIISIDGSEKIEDIATEHQDQLWSVCGIKVDAKNRVLWVNSSAVLAMRGNEEKLCGLAGVFKFDLEDKKMTKKYVLDTRPTLHLFNDLDVNSRGEVFITDSLYGAVYTIRPQNDQLELFIKPSRFTHPNGITFSSDERHIFVSHKEGVSVINVETKFRYILSHPDVMTLSEIDGLYYYKNSLIGIQNDNWRGRLVQFYLKKHPKQRQRQNIFESLRQYLVRRDEAFFQVEKIKIIESGNSLFKGPTTGVLVDDTFYFIANSQLGKLKPEAKVFPETNLDEIVILKVQL